MANKRKYVSPQNLFVHPTNAPMSTGTVPGPGNTKGNKTISRLPETDRRVREKQVKQQINVISNYKSSEGQRPWESRTEVTGRESPR